MSTTLLRSIVSTEFKTLARKGSISKPSLERWIELGVVCTCVGQSASISSVFTWTSLTPGRALHCSRKNAFSSICLVFRVDPCRLILLKSAEESQYRTCCVVEHVSSALFPVFRNQFHCCRGPMPSQAPDGAATNATSPLPSAIVDCF